MVCLVIVAPGHRRRGSFRGHKNCQAQQGSVIVLMRDDAWGAHPWVGAGGGANVPMELLSDYSTLQEGAPLSSYRYGSDHRVRRYTEALRALRQVVATAGENPSEVALHSSRIGAATTLAAAGEVPQRMTQTQDRWKSSECCKEHTRNNPEDAGMVSCRLPGM